jgi:hypothetical protein
MLKATWNVLERQIATWTLYGILNDPHNEFFIAANTEKVRTTSMRC